MSIKRMITKLAIAFAAKKGMDAFQGMGGLQGVKSALQKQSDSSPTTNASSSGGLADILDSLGLGTGGSSTAAGTGSIGSVLGTLAAALGGSNADRNADVDLANQFSQTDEVKEEESSPILRAMVQMARVDGSIDESEQAALFEVLDDASADEKAVLAAALREPIDAHQLANVTPSHARKEVYSGALLMSKPDLTARERDYLTALAKALHLEPLDLDGLHNAMGKHSLEVS